MAKHQKINTNTTTHSYIFSDLSRAIHRQEGLQRKLKHLITDNATLQNKIRSQAQEIKQERKTIIYQMNELSKSILAKLEVFEEKQLTMAMFSKEQNAHQILQQLMKKYEEIQKEENMITKTKDNMDRMGDAYKKHSSVLDGIVEEAGQYNCQNQIKVSSDIEQKRIQIQNKQLNNQAKGQQIQNMKDLMLKFEVQRPILSQKQEMLKKEIKKYEQIVNQKNKKCKQMQRWAKIVIDKQKRTELFESLSQKSKQLSNITNIKQNIEIKLNSEKCP